MISGVPKFGHISDYMRDTLHWLSVRQLFLCSFPSIIWRCAAGALHPDNLSARLPEVILWYRMRARPHAGTAIKQHRTFSTLGLSAWNSLPS